MGNPRIKIFYSADIHGSDRCFRKWVNAARAFKADVIVFGGDLAGKILQPIVDVGAGRYIADMYGAPITAEGDSGLAALREQIRNAGRYDIVVTAEEKRELDASPEVVHATFLRVARESATRWLQLADDRLHDLGVPAFMMLGNDDFTELKDVFAQSAFVIDPEDRVVELPGGFEMISLGYSNPTPWDSPRELPEEALGPRLDLMAAQLRDPAASVFNFHVPPQGTQLDQAALLDGTWKPITSGGQVQIGNVGSTSVRTLIERYQPIVSLHGHIHESPGMSKVGKTVAINPGSEYVDGILRGALVTIERGKGVRGWQLIQG